MCKDGSCGEFTNEEEFGAEGGILKTMVAATSKEEFLKHANEVVDGMAEESGLPVNLLRIFIVVGEPAVRGAFEVRLLQKLLIGNAIELPDVLNNILKDKAAEVIAKSQSASGTFH